MTAESRGFLPAVARPRGGLALRRLTIGALGAWGLMHVLGGVLLLASAFDSGGRPALESLGSAAPGGDIPGDPGPVVQAVVAFHAFNILMAGVAVTLLAAFVVRTRWPAGITSAVVVVTVLDAGLLFFLVLPGHMRLVEGVWGPAFLVVAAVAAFGSGWRPRQW